MTDARPDELDDDLVEPDRRLLDLKYRFDGAASLPELATELHRFADFERRASAGWRLDEPVGGGWVPLVRTTPR